MLVTSLILAATLGPSLEALDAVDTRVAASEAEHHAQDPESRGTVALALGGVGLVLASAVRVVDSFPWGPYTPVFAFTPMAMYPIAGSGVGMGAVLRGRHDAAFNHKPAGKIRAMEIAGWTMFATGLVASVAGYSVLLTWPNLSYCPEYSVCPAHEEARIAVDVAHHLSLGVLGAGSVLGPYASSYRHGSKRVAVTPRVGLGSLGLAMRF